MPASKLGERVSEDVEQQHYRMDCKSMQKYFGVSLYKACSTLW